jgi:hypothetical protein
VRKVSNIGGSGESKKVISLDRKSDNHGSGNGGDIVNRI